jgi:hypothetical protein
MTATEFLRARLQEADPTRAQADANAKRLILDLVVYMHDLPVMARLNLAICLWAAEFSGHEDYDPAWRPELWESAVRS